MQFTRSILNPKTYTSVSGEYVLYVNPSEPLGAGEATYRLTRKGNLLWKGIHPFTLWDAGIADDGTVGGYAYSKGLEGMGKSKTPGVGDFEIAILDSTGKARLHKKIKRRFSRYPDGLPSPTAEGLVMDSINNRLIVRVDDQYQEEGKKTWPVYQLSTGKELPPLNPYHFREPNNPARFVIDAQAVQGTPLILFHWWYYQDKNLGARFTLIDLEGKPVWSLELPQDYIIPGNEDAQDKLMNEIRSTGAILANKVPGQFTLRFVAEKQRVTFAVMPEEEGKWQVSEMHRESYVPLPPKTLRFDAPEIRLKLRGKIELRVPGPQIPHPIRKVFNLVAAGPQRFAFLRREDPVALVVVNNQGEAVHTVSLKGIPQKANDTIAKLLWQRGTTFLVFVERYAEKRQEEYIDAYQVEARTGTVAKFARLPMTTLESVAAFSDGGFVALTHLHFKYSITDQITAYDSHGRRVWGMESDGSRPDDGPEVLFNPESVTVLKDSSVAVLDNVRDTIQLYSRSGRYLRTISLKSAWGREPNYPTDIIADTQGGFIIHDFHGTPSVVWMNIQGKVLRSYLPRYASGTAIEGPEFSLMPNGNLWVTDTYSLLRLDAKGRVVQRLGDAPSVQRLGSIVELLIRPNGRILAADQRTNAVHVFDASGRWLHVCTPRKSAQESPMSMRDMVKQLEPGPNDSFAIDDEWFTGTGKRQAKPTGFRTLRERIKWISRRPDGTWLDRAWEYTSAPNGALAIVDEQERQNEKDQVLISLYSPTDKPEHLIRLPSVPDMYPIVAYDGKQVVLVGDGRIYACRPNGSPLWQSPTPSAKDTNALWRPFLTEGGRTLCLFDGKRTIYRYAMP